MANTRSIQEEQRWKVSRGAKSRSLRSSASASVATYGCGVARFDGSAWTAYTEKDGLLERHVLCATAASDGSMLFGTWGGVSHFDGRNWLSYTTADGLINHGVEAITEDPAGGVWFGTWAGIGRLSGSLWTSYDTGGVGTWVETNDTSSTRLFLDDFTPATSGAASATGRRIYRGRVRMQ